MLLTPETLPRHELVGLSVRVSGADDPGLLGIEGEVVAETTNTLGIEGADRVRRVPKAGTTFEFTLPSQGASEAPSGGEVVTVEGRRLVARPARRTENTGESTWR